VLTEIATLDAILQAHARELGDDFTLYRHHCYRLVNLCVARSSPDAPQLEKIAIAAAFHDLGIWTDGTFDYLQPSVKLASAYLAGTGKAEWVPEITEMILQHHKISPYRSRPEWLVEPFRRADWVDVTRGLVTLGLPRKLIGAVYATWPSAGFHKRLVQLELAHLRKHPLNPLPVFRL
jgi:hypothetical protein